jgi:NADH:ubiquinone oxidoreductase subunit H
MSSLLNSIDFPYVIGSLIKIAVFWIFIMLVVAYTVYAERRVLAVIQNRLGTHGSGLGQSAVAEEHLNQEAARNDLWEELTN